MKLDELQREAERLGSDEQRKLIGFLVAMEYEVCLRREALGFLRQLRPDGREHRQGRLQGLGRDPFRRGDFSERDASGREIEVLIIRRYAVLVWTDHAVKEVKVTDLRFADRETRRTMVPSNHSVEARRRACGPGWQLARTGSRSSASPGCR